MSNELGFDLPTGSHHYRAFVGPPEKYDLVAANQFNLLTVLGLREHHRLLDIGCGSLRGGRLFIPYLLPERYFGIEPEEWLVKEGIKNNVGRDLAKIKKPRFSADKDFTLTAFGVNFDFILAQSIFSHSSQNQIRRCLSEVKKVLLPDGIFAATFVKGDSDYVGDGWVYPGCVNYTEEKMHSLCKEADLSCNVLKWCHPNNQTWVAILHLETKMSPHDEDSNACKVMRLRDL
jgi:cyclopropane fatty-acyl-phospholipid synthase-like methyltransferase